MKLSFCVTCMNRLHQLRQTLAENLEAVRQDGNAEIVLVNYNSQDGLDEWVRDFASQIEAGLLRYGHETTAAHFHACKAKNLAHLLATGDYVINLDGDNFIDATIAPLREEWTKQPDAVIWLWSGRYYDGTYGRIGLPKDVFIRIGGYDETFLPMGIQDRDLIMRANIMGSPLVHLHYVGARALVNSISEKEKFLGMSESYSQMNRLNAARSMANISSGKLVANEDRSPVKLTLNFSDEIYV
jgi:glycosyltransferase involved in cell wall biosynthesis